ncbi:MAG: hypothetical protein JNN11_03340 [Candidatus Doudnabacteria bacterium]|nr:hypothetical protein [Candidatus Doudnabacteria bacterium]
MKTITWKICSRGHKFQKSSDCPVCPMCWQGYYKTRAQSDFPKKLAGPALRALLNAKIKKLSQLEKWSEKELSALHGMGPTGIKLLRTAMKKSKLSFKL